MDRKVSLSLKGYRKVVHISFTKIQRESFVMLTQMIWANEDGTRLANLRDDTFVIDEQPGSV